jgi:F-type H+-transporting ATPase subunit b
MLFLAEFTVIQPEIGLLFWTTIIFAVVWFFLGKSAFGPISKALQDREESIENALQSAEKARGEMAALSARNEELAKQAQIERAAIMKEAKAAKEQILKEAREQAKEESSKIIAGAQDEINRQKRSAMAEVKNMTASLALQIAGQVIQKDLAKDGAQQALVNDLVKDIKLN